MAVAVSDAAAMAIATAIKEQTALLEKNFGPGAGQTPGCIAFTINSINKQDELLVKSIGDVSKQLQTLNTNLASLAKQVDTITTGLGSMSVTASRQLATTQLMAANQISHTTFQQKTVNQALKEAGKEEVVVTPENFLDSAKTAVQDISTINAQTTSAAIVNNIITSTISESFLVVKNWAAGTAVGKFITDYMTVAKLQAKALFADDEAARVLRDQASAIIAARGGA